MPPEKVNFRLDGADLLERMGGYGAILTFGKQDGRKGRFRRWGKGKRYAIKQGNYHAKQFTVKYSCKLL